MKILVRQKVKCIADTFPAFDGFVPLKKDEIYTVKQILNEQDIKVEGSEYGWNKSCFIPCE